MGSMRAMELASGEFVSNIEQQISIHFSSNCYPPVPQFMVPVAIKAIDAFYDEDYDLMIDLPEGVEFRNSKTVSASNVIDALRLDAWVQDGE